MPKVKEPDEKIRRLKIRCAAGDDALALLHRIHAAYVSRPLHDPAGWNPWIGAIGVIVRRGRKPGDEMATLMRHGAMAIELLRLLLPMLEYMETENNCPAGLSELVSKVGALLVADDQALGTEEVAE